MQHDGGHRCSRRREQSFSASEEHCLNESKRMRMKGASFSDGFLNDFDVSPNENERHTQIDEKDIVYDKNSTGKIEGDEFLPSGFPSESCFELIPELGNKLLSLTSDSLSFLESFQKSVDESQFSSFERLDTFQEMSSALDSLFGTCEKSRYIDAQQPNANELQPGCIFDTDFQIMGYQIDSIDNSLGSKLDASFTVNGKISDKIQERLPRQYDRAAVDVPLKTSYSDHINPFFLYKSSDQTDKSEYRKNVHRAASQGDCLGGPKSFFNRPISAANLSHSFHGPGAHRRRSPYASTPSFRRNAGGAQPPKHRTRGFKFMRKIDHIQMQLRDEDRHLQNVSLNPTAFASDQSNTSEKDSSSPLLHSTHSSDTVRTYCEYQRQPSNLKKPQHGGHPWVTSKRQTSEEVAKRLPVSVLESFYHVPLNTAARELSVSLTMLKKLCRQYGIKRWPHRQVLSLNKSITKLESRLTHPDEEKVSQTLVFKLDGLKKKRALIVKTASAGLDTDVLNAVFAARPNEIDEDELLRTGDFSNLRSKLEQYLKVRNQDGKGANSAKVKGSSASTGRKYSCKARSEPPISNSSNRSNIPCNIKEEPQLLNVGHVSIPHTNVAAERDFHTNPFDLPKESPHSPLLQLNLDPNIWMKTDENKYLLSPNILAQDFYPYSASGSSMFPMDLPSTSIDFSISDVWFNNAIPTLNTNIFEEPVALQCFDK